MTDNRNTDADLPILATAVVPWTNEGVFEETVFVQQILLIATKLTPNIYIFGTAGEGYAVSESQFRRIASCFWETCALLNANPMLGVISLSLNTIIERIEWGRSVGFRRFQISLPSWGTLTDLEMAVFFDETCGRFPDCEFLHYNLVRAGRMLGPEDYKQLVARHHNLVAVKMGISDPATIRSLLQATPRVRFFFTETGYAIARKTSKCGLLISLASVNYERAIEFVRGNDQLREEYSAELQLILNTLIKLSEGNFHMDGAFDKLLFRMNDAHFPLRLLPPYSFPSENDAKLLREALPMRWRNGK